MRKSPMGWRKRRLLAIKLAAKGASTSAEVAEWCGIARSHLYQSYLRDLARATPEPSMCWCATKL